MVDDNAVLHDALCKVSTVEVNILFSGIGFAYSCALQNFESFICHRMKYDQLYDEIGQIGVYQWLIFACYFVITMFLVDAIHSIFIGGSMDHWCQVEELAGISYEIQKYVAIPFEGDDNVTSYSSCKMFALNYSVYNETQFVSWNRSAMTGENTQIVDCQKWTYDQSTFTSTIVRKVRMSLTGF